MTDTKRPELSIERFERLVEAYGADLERFPERERVPAKALVLRSPEARRMLEAARALDVMLATVRDGTPSVELRDALSEIPERHAQERPLVGLLPFRSRRGTWVAAVAALGLGVLSGQFAANGQATERLGDQASGLEQADLGSLAFADELFEELVAQEGSEE